uniref:Thioredoxin domain-containing protein n=1 Tax=Kalanchoe fedtschenkoi TaxID=63787 RepID=A0A7N0U9B2_KALFE
MACGLRSDAGIGCPNNGGLFESRRGFGACPSVVNLKSGEAKSKAAVADSLSSDFKGRQVHVADVKTSSNWCLKTPTRTQVYAQASICVSKAHKWWEKSTQPNMVEVKSAQQLVNALKNVGDRLVIVDFYSPGCGGCRTLHPKICQLAESNPDAIILKVNYEDLKTMSQALHIRVLPFFRFYRGVDGKVCSFSCTNATIKKFKDALAKYGGDRPSIGPAKGLDESELLKLASMGEISLDSVPGRNEERIGDLLKEGFEAWTGAGLAGDGAMAMV